MIVTSATSSGYTSSTAAEWRPPVEVQVAGYTVRVDFDAWGNPTARIVAPALAPIVWGEHDPFAEITDPLAARTRRRDAWWASRCAELGLSDHLRRLARPRAVEAAAPTVGVREDRLRRHAAAVRRVRL